MNNKLLLFTLLFRSCAAFDPYLVTCLVNYYRSSYGLNALGVNSGLQQSAQGHSNYQAYTNFMSHTGYAGSSPGQRVYSFGIDWVYVGENVAFGYTDEYDVMDGWMNSPGHRANILSRNYKMIGNALTIASDGTPYYTQDFATDRTSTYNIPDCSRYNVQNAASRLSASTKDASNNDTKHHTGFSAVEYVNPTYVNSTAAASAVNFSSDGTGVSHAASVHTPTTQPSPAPAPPASTLAAASVSAKGGGDVFGVPHSGSSSPVFSNVPATSGSTNVEIFGIPHGQTASSNANANGSMKAASVHGASNAAPVNNPTNAAPANLIGTPSAVGALKPIPLGNGKVITFPGFQVTAASNQPASSPPAAPPVATAASQQPQMSAQSQPPMQAQQQQPQQQQQQMLQKQSQQQQDVSTMNEILELLKYDAVLLRLGVADDGVTPTLLVSTYKEEQTSSSSSNNS